MMVKMMIFIFEILAISMLKPGSAEILQNQSIQYVQENVALRGKATQSALYAGGSIAYSHASNAIDGNRDANFYHGSCSCTTNGPNPWWRVDLLQTYVITSVTITNRRDCCSERIGEAQIRIGDSLENNGVSNPQCSMISFLGAGETKTFYCGKVMKGRYVTVYLPKTEYLTLCEVEVNAWLPVPQ